MKVNELQKWCYKLEKHTGERDNMVLLGEAAQEFGEAIRSILMHEGVKVRRQEDNIAKELFDLFYNLSVISSKHDIDLEEVFTKAISKYEKRFEVELWENLKD
tara:strand:+ start:238 stop:546 length:309 start_codon:yes stop_codon:yes gene_type:complete